MVAESTVGFMAKGTKRAVLTEALAAGAVPRSVAKLLRVRVVRMPLGGEGKGEHEFCGAKPDRRAGCSRLWPPRGRRVWSLFEAAAPLDRCTAAARPLHGRYMAVT